MPNKYEANHSNDDHSEDFVESGPAPLDIAVQLSDSVFGGLDEGPKPRPVVIDYSTSPPEDRGNWTLPPQATISVAKKKETCPHPNCSAGFLI